MKTILFALMSVYSLSSFARVIYGTDDRKDFFEVQDQLIQDQMESTATFTLRGLITPMSYGHFSVTQSLLGKSLNLCPGTTFEDQPSIGACSATLVSPKHLLTAGHCMPDQKRCEEIYLLFGFHNYKAGEYLQTAKGQDVYRCKKLLVRRQDDQMDFALIELDREVTDRRPVVLETETKVQRGQTVRLIGYPDGIPSKVVSGGKVRSSANLKFVSNVDAFKGNSGSALFSEASNKMVGVLFKGNLDYTYNNRRDCRELNVCKENDCRGEDATHVASIWPLIKQYLE